MVELAKMAGEERDESHWRDGYRKILDSCGEVDKNGHGLI